MAFRAVKFSLNLSPETQVPKPVENPIDADVTNVSAIAAPAIFKSCAKIFELLKLLVLFYKRRLDELSR